MLFTLIIWITLIEALWFLSFPTLFVLLRHSPDRGFSVSPVFGLLFGSYPVWLLASTGVIFSTISAIIISIVSFIILNGLLFWWGKGKLVRQLLFFFKARWRIVVSTQLVFGIVLLLLLFIRRYLPDIHISESLFDNAIFRAILQSETMPPPDPWLAGYSLNYYYYGHFILAYLTKLSGIDPAVTYNLFLATIFALTAAAALGIGYNLFGRGKHKKTALAVGLLAAFLICFAGNPDSTRQWLAPNQRDTANCTPKGNFLCFWWNPARVIYDTRITSTPSGVKVSQDETINEFPFFSFILGDNHAHVIAYQFQLFGLALILNLCLAPNSEKKRRSWVYLAVLGWFLGATYIINSWHYPLHLLFIIGVLLWKDWRTHKIRWGLSVLKVTALIATSIIFFLPFHLSFHSFVGRTTYPLALDLPLLRDFGKNVSLVTWEKTSLVEYLLVFGFFSVGMVSFLAFKLWGHFKKSIIFAPNSSAKFWNPAYLLPCGLSLLAFSQLGAGFAQNQPLLLLVIGFGGLGLVIYSLVFASFAQLKGLVLLCGWFGLILLGFTLNIELLGPLLIILMASALLLWYESKKKLAATEAFSLIAVFLFALLSFLLEFFYLRDVGENRFNSIGKFYMQLWVLGAIVTAYAFGWGFIFVSKKKFYWKVIWLVGTIIIILAACVYPVIATKQRTGEFAQSKGLNGEYWLVNFSSPDYAAIIWLREQAKNNSSFAAPILELTGPDYVGETTRVSSFTGFPAMVGWVNAHELIYRSYDSKLVSNLYERYRWASGELYLTMDVAKTEEILRQYNIKYVFVGSLEHSLLEQKGLQGQANKFSRFMNLIYDRYGVQIYAFPEIKPK